MRDLTDISAAVARYTGRATADEISETTIADMLADLEHLAKAKGVPFDIYRAHEDFLAEQGICYRCGTNPETAAAEDDKWDWGTCAGDHELEGRGAHHFDDLTEAGMELICQANNLGYRVIAGGSGHNTRTEWPIGPALNDPKRRAA
jgi:hypothetical protein